jgi:phytoene dehydrogenase-like protein
VGSQPRVAPVADAVRRLACMRASTAERIWSARMYQREKRRAEFSENLILENFATPYQVRALLVKIHKIVKDNSH